MTQIIDRDSVVVDLELDGGDGLRIESETSDVIIDGGYFEGGQPGEYTLILDQDANMSNVTINASTNLGYAAHIQCNSLVITNDVTFSGRLFLHVNEFTISENSTSQIDILESNTNLSIDSYTKGKIKAFLGSGMISVIDTGEQFIANDYDSDNDDFTDSDEVNKYGT